MDCHFLLQCMKVKVKSFSRVWLFSTPWTAAYQASLSMGFSRQEYWSGVPSPSPQSNFYSPLINRFLLSVCVGGYVCVYRWDEGSEESVEQKRNQKTEAKKRTIGNNSVKIALIFFLYLLALNNSIHFTSVNTIVILLFSPFPLAPLAHKQVPKPCRSHLWRKALNADLWHFVVLGV